MKALTNTCFNMHILFSNQSYSISSPTVLYCYNHMYRTFADSKFLCSLTHSSFVFNNIACNFHCPFFDIIFQRISLRRRCFYSVCTEIPEYVAIIFIVVPYKRTAVHTGRPFRSLQSYLNLISFPSSLHCLNSAEADNRRSEEEFRAVSTES